jgi:hypothetical protein
MWQRNCLSTDLSINKPRIHEGNTKKHHNLVKSRFLIRLFWRVPNVQMYSIMLTEMTCNARFSLRKGVNSKITWNNVSSILLHTTHYIQKSVLDKSLPTISNIMSKTKLIENFFRETRINTVFNFYQAEMFILLK